MVLIYMKKYNKAIDDFNRFRPLAGIMVLIE